MLGNCLLLVVITVMPATRRTMVDELRSTTPYSLSGALQPHLTALTVAALKSHLKYFMLSTTRKKSELVGRLHTHLHADNTTDPQVTETSNSQQGASLRDMPINARTDAEPRQNAPHQADVPALSQQFLDQLTTILQQARYSATHSGTPQPDAIKDDRLSAASLQVRSNHPLPMQVLRTRSSTQVNPPCSSGPPTLLPTPSLPHPTLPPIPTRIQRR